jgi:hypothetical protein
MRAPGEQRGSQRLVLGAVARVTTLACALAACRDDGEAPAELRVNVVLAAQTTAPSAAYSDDGPYRFRDATEASGLGGFVQLNGSKEKLYLVESVGGGCALFDADQDGDLDAYLTNGGELGRSLETTPSDALYTNDGRGRFSDASRAAGIDERRWSNGVRTCDLDADGWTDLYVTNCGRNTLYLADGRGAFVDRTAASGLGVDSWSTGASFFDFDKDGDLDLHVVNYVVFRVEEKHVPETNTYKGITVLKGPLGLEGAADRFYVNQGGLEFVERSAELGLAEAHYGFQNLVFDFDHDGWLDLYVANDSVANSLWRNLEGERFEDLGLRRGVAFSISGRAQAGMGACLGDYDGDRRVDVYVTNFADDYSTLYRGEDGGFFLDVTQSVGLASPTTDKLAWSTGFVDFDLDGDEELYAVNGHVYPQVDLLRTGSEYRQVAQLFEFQDGRFREPKGRGGSAFAVASSGRGGATGDVDGDGDLDLLIENIDAPPRLLVNEGPSGRAVEVVLIGAAGNREAIGARVVGRAGERRMLRLAGVANGFLSSSDRTLVFGLGAAAQLDELEVTWPSGRTDRFQACPAGARLSITEKTDGAAVVSYARRE